MPGTSLLRGVVYAATVAHARAVVASLAGILAEGQRAGRFAPVNPLVLHGSIIAPLMFFLATARVRRRIDRDDTFGAAAVRVDAVVAHIQQLALVQLEGKVL